MKSKRDLDDSVNLKKQLTERLRRALDPSDIRVTNLQASASAPMVLPIEFDQDPTDPVHFPTDADGSDTFDHDPADPEFPPGV